MPTLDHAALHQLSPELRQAITAADLPSLGDGPTNPQLKALLQTPGSGLPSEVPADAGAARACEAALWLLAGDLDRSHQISQSLESADGSFWHGVMHRREGDFQNAKYWFRRAGHHPALETLGSHVAADALTRSLADELVSESGWDTGGFVDHCQRATKQGGGEAERCRRAQWIEWQTMFADCLQRAWPT